MKEWRLRMFCGECGTQNPDTNQFCKNCGKPLPRHQPAVQPGTPPAAPQMVPPAPVPVAPAAPAGAVLQQAPASVPAAAVPGHRRNWLGFLSLLLGFLSWGILTVILAIVAVLLGIISLIWFRKAAGKIGISSIIGILLGLAAIIVLVVLA